MSICIVRIQFELHDNSELIKLECVVEFGMLSVRLQANPCLSQSQMCCSQTMCLPCEQQPWATARQCAVNRHDGCLITCRVIKFSKDTHFITHCSGTNMHLQMHTQWYKWDFSLGGTLEHEHNHLFLAGFVLLLSSSFFFFFLLVYFYSYEYIFLQMLVLFI